MPHICSTGLPLSVRWSAASATHASDPDKSPENNHPSRFHEPLIECLGRSHMVAQDHRRPDLPQLCSGIKPINGCRRTKKTKLNPSIPCPKGLRLKESRGRSTGVLTPVGPYAPKARRRPLGDNANELSRANLDRRHGNFENASARRWPQAFRGVDKSHHARSQQYQRGNTHAIHGRFTVTASGALRANLNVAISRSLFFGFFRGNGADK